MKLQILLLTILCKTFMFADIKNEVDALNKIFMSINEQRHGLEKDKIHETKNPFLMEKNARNTDKEKNLDMKKEKSEYTLKAILNNRALINDTWVALHNTIGDYKLIKINYNSVTLDSGGVEKKLQIKGDKNNGISIK